MVLGASCVFLCIALLILAGVVAFIQPTLSESATRFAMALVFQILVAAIVLVLLIRLALGYLRDLGFTRKNYLTLAIILLVLCVAGLLFIYFYFQAEQEIKTYDATTYWTRLIDSRVFMENSLSEYFVFLQQSLSQEYSSLIAFPLVLPSYLFGLEFTGYCQSVFLIYYLPTSLFLSLLVMRIVTAVRKEKPSLFILAVILALCVFSPVFFWPLIHGYADVAGVLFMVLILNYTFTFDRNSLFPKSTESARRGASQSVYSKDAEPSSHRITQRVLPSIMLAS